jgi:hypothetical protein|tara:strand:+ start:126 stop:317 length:192 start_codon:yes stop_codon:yes gene_type:complete
MAYYITKPASIDKSITLYFVGENRWSDNPSNKITYETEEIANSAKANPDGTNGGFTGSTVVSE